MALEQLTITRCIQTATLASALLYAGFGGAAGLHSSAGSKAATDTHLALHYEPYADDEAWISDIGTLLYGDPDEDGYFSGLSLSIDADTAFSSQEVYVTIDLIDVSSVSEHSVANGPDAERLHTTRNFELYGRSATDEYRIDIDLVQNYSPGTYDLHIALIDSHDNRILDEVGADDFRNLSTLPLESEDNVTVHIPVVEQPLEAPNDDIRVVEYAGSTGFWMFGLLLIILSSRVMSGGLVNVDKCVPPVKR